MKRETTMRKWRFEAAAWGACVALLVAGCGGGEEKKAEAPEEAEEKAMAVEVATLSTSDFERALEFPGVAEPITERMVAAETGGRILSAPFEEGAQVKKGALMLRVDAKATSAQLDLIDAQISAANREYKRIKELASQGLATPQQLDQTKTQLQQAKLSKKQAKIGKAMATVRSPFTGWVARKMAEEGEFAGPGQPIAQLIDYSTVKLTVTVPESDISYIEVGGEVDVHFTAAGITRKGKVARRGLMVSMPTATFPVEVHVDNEDLGLVPGMRARVRVPRDRLSGVVVVPRDAILEGFAQREAMVVGGDGRAELRVVELGPGKGNDVVIESGLAAGDRLIVKGHRNVVSGSALRIVAEDGGAAAAAPKSTPPATEEAAPAENDDAPAKAVEAGGK
jgi:membrane fusion protein (multidrug efflux system)